MWSAAGKRREMGLGAYPTVSLAKARSKAGACREAIDDGRDPIVERDREPGKTFGEVADAYLKAHKGSWRNAKHVFQWEHALEVRCKPIRSKPVAEITTDDVLKIIEPIWSTLGETASRIRGRIERVLDFARVHEWRTGENPAAWQGHLRNRLPARKRLARGHHAAMPYVDVPTFVARLRETESTAARSLELVILTAARSGEVLGARWSEFDLDGALWTIPPARMKAGEEHVVPLSTMAVALIRKQAEVRTGEFVFPSHRDNEKPQSNMVMAMLLRRMKESFTVHGFRSAFRDWAGDRTSFTREVAEAALAHQVGNAVEQAYRRGSALEKRRQLMDAWSRYVTSKPARNVLPFPREKSA
jgi:integrase